MEIDQLINIHTHNKDKPYSMNKQYDTHMPCLTHNTRYSFARNKGHTKKSIDMRRNTEVIYIHLGLWLDLEGRKYLLINKYDKNI